MISELVRESHQPLIIPKTLACRRSLGASGIFVQYEKMDNDPAGLNSHESTFRIQKYTR